MVDITYQPTITEEDALLVIKQENRVNTRRVCERTGFDETQVKESLQTLKSHGWIKEVTEDLYEFVDDPRGSPDRMDPRSDPNKETQTAPINPEARQEDTDRS